MGCNSNTASLEINKKFKKSSFYQRQWACYFEYSVEPKSEQRGTRGGLCCWEGAGPRSLLLQSVQCPSLRVFYAGIGKKETLFSKNSALSQLDKHLKIKAAQLKLAVHPHSFVSLFIFFPSSLNMCATAHGYYTLKNDGLELSRLAPRSARPPFAV